MTTDPITFEIVRHRLFRIIEEAVITLKHVSGSATTNEGHDLMVSLYTARGELLMGGVGFLHHLSSAAEACKAILRRFANKIEPGDVYLLNDPYTAALHTSDVYLVAPIHVGGELVAWSACFVHVNDIGAINPGGFCPDARDVFSEGFSSPGIRIVRAGELLADVLDTLLNMVRSPEMVALDIRSMIACNHVARERFVALVAKYGRDTVLAIGAELIAQSGRLFRERLRELPEGEWRAAQFMDVEGVPLEIRLAMTKRGDTLHFDFAGSSAQSDRGVNCTRWAAWGGLLAPLYPLLAHDLVWNEGLLAAVSMNAPEGTIVNCQRPAPVSIATTAAVQAVNNVSLTCISKMLAESKYRDEATAVWHGSHLCLYLFAKNPRGEPVIGSTTETFAGSGGARWGADGIDVGGEIPNPISRIANVETNESIFPIRYLFRRRMRDSGGAGRHRGGTGGEYAIVPHDRPEFGFVVSGKGVDFPMGHGLAGGYPGAPGRYVIARSRADGAPQSLSELGGEQQPVSWGVYTVREGDALYVRWNGAGGLGDPLERDPQACVRDVAEGIASREAVEILYGVDVNDPERTARLRAAMRTGRQRVAGDAPCPRCNAAAVGERARRLAEVAPAYTTGAGAYLRERICGACGAVVDAEVAMVATEAT